MAEQGSGTGTYGGTDADAEPELALTLTELTEPEEPAGRAEAKEGDVIDVVGVGVPADQATPTVPRPRVVIVTDAWGADWGERAAATRLVAGALALRARVSIVSLEDRSKPRSRNPKLRYDGLFPIYSVAAPPLPATTELRTNLLRTALIRQPGSALPDVAARGHLAAVSKPSTEAILTTVGLEPDVVILAGKATFWLGAALPVGPGRPRVIVLPLSGDDQLLSSAPFRPLAYVADAIGAFSGREYDRIAGILPDTDVPKLHRVEIALPVNRLAAAAGMAGVASFGRYVLVISSFDEDAASAVSPPHEYLRQLVGDVAIAEVRRGGWVVTAPEKRFDITWAPSRMNLWRLMARAAVTVDLRPQGPIGRDAIESLRFGTPVVVPDGSVAAEHAASSNGGLWYRNHGELVASLRTLLDDEEMRVGFGASGQSWAEHHHGDTDTFVEQVLTLVLGPSLLGAGPVPLAGAGAGAVDAAPAAASSVL
jgi:hypothetical protein